MAEIYFADGRVKDNYEKLKANEEFRDLYYFIQRALDDIRKKPDCRVTILWG